MGVIKTPREARGKYRIRVVNTIGSMAESGLLR